MKKRNRIQNFLIVSLVFFQTTAVVAEAPKLNVSSEDAIQLALEAMKGKDVTLKLDSGQEVAGKVTEVGKEVVHLSQLKGMEFFDAAVSVEDISAVVFRAK